MKAIVDMRESLGKDYLPEENFMLNKAEKDILGWSLDDTENVGKGLDC